MSNRSENRADPMKKIAIVGCGLVGRGWSISFARAGFRVALWDRDEAAPQRALAYIGDILAELERHELLNGATPAEVAARIEIAPGLQAALDGAAHIQESTFEDETVKRAVFAELDAAAPADAVIASSTSALLPSRFTDVPGGRHRCLVAHPLNPPYLIPAVEIVPAPWTGAEAVEATAALLKSAGHAPIVMERELDGFLVNRLQGALFEEAFRLVESGVASVEDVDACLRDGLAPRWSIIGPFETADLNAPGGVRDYAERYASIYELVYSQSQYRVDWTGPVMDTVERQRRAALPADKLAERQAWRDRRLIALAAHRLKATREHGS